MASRDPQVLRIVSELNQFTSRNVRDIGIEVTAELRRDTPVDTGWAAANWTPSIGQDVVRRESDNPTVLMAQARAVFQQTQVAALLGYKLDMGNIFIYNNVPYIQELNDGKSGQAPAAFVQAAVRKGVANVKARPGG